MGVFVRVDDVAWDLFASVQLFPVAVDRERINILVSGLYLEV